MGEPKASCFFNEVEKEAVLLRRTAHHAGDGRPLEQHDDGIDRGGKLRVRGIFRQESKRARRNIFRMALLAFLEGLSQLGIDPGGCVKVVHCTHLRRIEVSR